MLIAKVIICQCVSVFSAQLLTWICEFTFIGCLRSSKSAMGWSFISPCCSGFVLLLMLSQMRKPSFCALVQLQWWKKIPLMMQRPQKCIKSHVSNMLHITIDRCMCNISLLRFFLLPDTNIALSFYFKALKTYIYKFIVLL